MKLQYLMLLTLSLAACASPKPQLTCNWELDTDGVTREYCAPVTWRASFISEPIGGEFADIDCSKPGMAQYQECEPVENSCELDDEDLSPNDCARGIDEANQEACQK